MDLDPKRLYILLAVARTGSVLAAADDLHVSPSAVSQQLKKLEQDAGASLVQRTPRGTVLTPAGVIVAEAAEEIERAIGNARDRLEKSDGPSGTVRIGGIPSFLRTLLVPRLAEWRERYPQLLIQVTEGDLNSLTRRLRRRQLDAAVVDLDSASESDRLPAGITEQPLLDEPWKLVVPSPWFVGTDPVDLTRSSWPWLGVDASSGSAAAIARLRKAAMLETTSVHEYYETLTALALVAAGQGIAVEPALALHGMLPDNVSVLDMPGLGTRRIVLRRFETNRSLHSPVDVLVALIQEAVSALDLHAAAG
ncbi:LysR family transcriptional regulator [Arthrobacter sp. HMWF013]|uniref:LysR family transcriptional regulator n=1 Tax=Arthrobacter sp. HMWF013 TaxID=2056849 RepID=UPI000D396DE8|nr:LysR family transcriptional regulator [Arthrobacter sp. HMWF013]PTT70778.1 LysR family transcriptional regulator [Arthrobacter sp. HMWF013]